MIGEKYTEDPFQYPMEYRTRELKEGKLSTYKQFLKNLIAFIFYKEEYKMYVPKTSHHASQNMIFTTIFTGNIARESYHDSCAHVISSFMTHEIAYQDESDPINEVYIRFIEDNRNKLEILENLITLDMQRLDFKDFVCSKAELDENIKIDEIATLFNDMEHQLLYMIKHEYLHGLELLLTNRVEFKDIFRKLSYHLNPKLVDEEELLDLQKKALQWFDQMIVDHCYHIEFRENPDCYDKLREDLVAILKPELQPDDEEGIDYPKDIFTNARAFQLFDAYARHHHTRKAIDYLYRRMSERDKFIKVRDAAFRNWFNGKEYVQNLMTTTETLARTETAERKDSVDLLYTVYGLK